MAKNRTGNPRSGNLEWGSKARKEEDRLRGLNNTARRLAVEEQIEEILSYDPEDVGPHDDGPEAFDWYGEAFAAQFDDDPNPYHGTYSED